MTPRTKFMQFWTKKSRAESQAPSKVPSPSKWGVLTDRVCKTPIPTKGQSCSYNFGGKLLSRYYRLYLEKPPVLEVTAKVTAPSKSGGQKEGESPTSGRASTTPFHPITPPPRVLPPGVYPALIVEVSKPKRRWGGRTVIRIRFWLNPPEEGPVICKWVTLNYTHPGSALRRLCALLVGEPTANFRALVNRSCLVEIVHVPGKKHPVLMLPARIGKADGSAWVPLSYGFHPGEDTPWELRKA